MIIFTAAYTYRGADRLDITRAGNDRRRTIGNVLAPSGAILWPALREMKLDREAAFTRYRELYLAELHARWRRPAEWTQFLRLEQVTMVCFCAEPAFCHRTLAAGFLVGVGAGSYEGERLPIQPSLF